MTTISAELILSSRSPSGKVLTTLKLKYPRWIHAEFMTHRVFSRNSASSRAIPVERMIKAIVDDPAIPLFWGKNCRGMQSQEECNELVIVSDKLSPRIAVSRELAWVRAMEHAVSIASEFAEAGYHKQIVNRLLEPFAHITVVVSSTEWENFFAQRLHKDAEPHMQLLAQCIHAEVAKGYREMWDLEPSEWHLPFIKPFIPTRRPSASLVKSVACCAHTSYETVNGEEMAPETANRIFNQLLDGVPPHYSPMEHAARVGEFHRPSNFVGFTQLRKLVETFGTSEFWGRL